MDTKKKKERKKTPNQTQLPITATQATLLYQLNILFN